jgi:FtsZ-interacting cell division protein ZipA
MDTQRYGGLNIFAVLPGPLPAPAAFEELLASARQLNERLQGTLQDERGDALTAARIAIVRAELAGQAAPPEGAPP